MKKLLFYVHQGALAVGTLFLWSGLLLGLGYTAWLVVAGVWYAITH